MHICVYMNECRICGRPCSMNNFIQLLKRKPQITVLLLRQVAQIEQLYRVGSYCDFFSAYSTVYSNTKLQYTSYEYTIQYIMILSHETSTYHLDKNRLYNFKYAGYQTEITSHLDVRVMRPLASQNYCFKCCKNHRWRVKLLSFKT